MAEESESEETGRLVSESAPPPPSTDAQPSLPPRKRLLASLDQTVRASLGSSSSASSVRLRNPNLSSCHVCCSRISSNRGKDKLQTLDSQWRIVLLCNNCFHGVQSAKNCSYCFTEISDVGISCVCCDRRVHGDCVSKYRGLGLCSKSDSFTCIDCWVPKSLNGVPWGRNPNGSSKIVSGNCSVKISRASSLDDVAAKDANSTAELKIAAAARARERASKKAVLARRAAEMAKNALDLVAAAVREDSQLKDSRLSGGLAADDTKLAFLLHRTINSSPRISKNLGSMDLGNLVAPKLRKGNGYLLDRQSDHGSHSVHGELEVCTNNTMLENPDKVVSEPSVRIGSLDHSSSMGLGVLEPKMKVYTRESHKVKNFKKNGEDAFMGNFEKGLEHCYWKQEVLEHKVSSNSGGTHCQFPCDEDSSTPEKKKCHGSDMYLRKYSKRRTSIKSTLDQSSSHVNECKENGDDSVMGNFDRGLQASLIRLSNGNGIVELPVKEQVSCYLKQEGLVPKVSSNNRGTQCQSACDEDTSIPERKRCHGPDMYLKTYSKRHTSLKVILHQKTKVLFEDSPLESQASTPGLSSLQLNCSNVCRTFSDASFQSSSAPVEASAQQNGPSGHQS